MKILITQAYFLRVVLQIALVIVAYYSILRIMLPFIKNDKWHGRVKFYLPVVRNIFLALIVLEIIVNLGVGAPLITLGVVALITILLWNYIRELFLGTVFRVQRGDITGQKLEVDGYGGKIIALNNTKIELETEKSEVLQIPYSKVIQDVEVKPSSAKHLKSCSVVVSVKEHQFQEFKTKMLNAIASIPYVVDSIKPKIEIVNQDSSDIECKVVVYTNDDSFVAKIKSSLIQVVA